LLAPTISAAFTGLPTDASSPLRVELSFTVEVALGAITDGTGIAASEVAIAAVMGNDVGMGLLGGGGDISCERAV